MEERFNPHGAQKISSVTVLAKLSGRDADDLATADGSVRSQSAMLGLIFTLAALIHTAGIFGAMFVLFGSGLIALPLAVLAGGLIFTAERMILASHDEAKAKAAYEELRGEKTHRFARLGYLIPLVVRLAFALVVAWVVADFGGQFVYEPAILDRIEQRQQEEDEDIYSAAREQLARRTTQLENVLEDAERALAEAIQARNTVLETVERDIGLLDDEIDRLLDKRKALIQLEADQTSEVDRQRDIAYCEANAPDYGCEGTSGDAGEGPNYRAAVSRAETASQRAREASNEIAAINTQLAALEQQRASADEIDTQALQVAIRKAEERKKDAGAYLAEHEATILVQINEIVAQNELRRIYDPSSLSVRLEAFGQLKSENEEFRSAIFKIKALVLAFELLPLLVILGVSSNSYDLQGGERIYDRQSSARAMHDEILLTSEKKQIAAGEAESRINAARSDHRKHMNKVKEGIEIDAITTERKLAQIAHAKKIAAARKGDCSEPLMSAQEPMPGAQSGAQTSGPVIDVFDGQDDPCLKNKVENLKTRIFFSSTVDASGRTINHVLQQSWPQSPTPSCNAGLFLSSSGLALAYGCGCIKAAARKNAPVTTLHPGPDGRYLPNQAEILTDGDEQPMTVGDGNGVLLRFEQSGTALPRENIKIRLSPPKVGDEVFCIAQIQGIMTLAEGKVLEIRDTPFGTKIRVDSEAGHGFCGGQLTAQDGTILGLGATIRRDMEDKDPLPKRAYGDSEYWLIGPELKTLVEEYPTLAKELEFVL